MNTLPRNHQLALISLQGLANRTSSQIYLNYNEETDWLASKVYSKLSKFSGAAKYTNISTMISYYKSRASVKGVVIWDPSRPYTLNIATNLSGVKNLLIFSPDMRSLAKSLRLTVVYDLTTMFKASASEAVNFYQAQSWVYNSFYGQQSSSWLANFYFFNSHDRHRDFAIQNKIHVFWLPSPGGQGCQAAADPEYSQEMLNLVQYIMQHSPRNIPVLGFWPSADLQGQSRGFCEYAGVKLAGQFGKYTVVSDWATNYSFHSKQTGIATLKQTLVRSKTFRAYNPNKKYVALIMHESGDSPGYMQYNFRYAFWDDPARGQVPISYGLAPHLKTLMPVMAEHLYATATANDFFYSSVSGLGYSYPFLGYGDYGVMAPGTSKITSDKAQIMADYFQKTRSSLQSMDMDMMGLYSSAWTAWDPSWIGYLNQSLLPAFPELKAVIADMGRSEGMTANAAASTLGNGTTSLFRTLTRWHTFPSGPDLWLIDRSTASTAANYNEAAAQWLADEIVNNSSGGQFIQAMAYSWNYNPTRLKMVQDKLQPLGYEFVTLNEFDSLYRQALTVNPPVAATASGIWNNDTSGAFSAAKVFDGNFTSRWASNNDGKPSWVQVDLGATRFVTGATIAWESAGSYRIDVSIDGVTYANAAVGFTGFGTTSVHNLTQNGSGGWWARYIRVAPATTTDPQYRSIWEITIQRQ
ncbi:MAG: discoidin domain-containing protein [Pseudobdellovibrionaceae bacterium]